MFCQSLIYQFYFSSCTTNSFYWQVYIFIILAQNIWEIGNKKDNPHDFATAVDESELEAFGFTDDFIFDLWGSISDAKSGRLNKQQDFSQNFWSSDQMNSTKCNKTDIARI